MIHSRRRFEQWLPAGFDGEFDWDFLKMAFTGTKIEPMDLDAVVERNGHFLVFETKDTGKGVPIGQAITLRTAWRKGFTVIHVEGKTAPEISGFAVYSEWDEDKSCDFGSRPLKKGNSVDLLYTTRAWFCRASGMKVPTRKEWEVQIWVEDYQQHEADAA
jgi:hypothetical protein